jgi:hypothetical protein
LHRALDKTNNFDQQRIREDLFLAGRGRTVVLRRRLGAPPEL